MPPARRLQQPAATLQCTHVGRRSRTHRRRLHHDHHRSYLLPDCHPKTLRYTLGCYRPLTRDAQRVYKPHLEHEEQYRAEYHFPAPLFSPSGVTLSGFFCALVFLASRHPVLGALPCQRVNSRSKSSPIFLFHVSMSSVCSGIARILQLALLSSSKPFKS